MQRLTTERPQCFDELRRSSLRQQQPTAVHAIADERITDVRHVHADLVRASRLRASSARACARDSASTHPIVRDRLAAVLANRHAHAIDADAARSAHRPRRRRSSRRVQTASYSRSTSRASIARTSAVCASSVRATTINPLVSLSSRCTMPARGTCASFGSRCSSAFCKRAGRVAGARVHDQPGRLVQDQDVAVLMDDVQLDLFRLDPAGSPRPPR